MFYNSQGGTQYSSVYSQGGAGSINLWQTPIPPFPTPSLFWPFNGSNVDSITGSTPYFSTIDNGTTFAPTYGPGISGQQAIYFNNSTWTSGKSLSNIVLTTTASNFNMNNFSISSWIYLTAFNYSQFFLYITTPTNQIVRQYNLTAGGVPSFSIPTNAGVNYTFNLTVGTWYNFTQVCSNVGSGTNRTTQYVYVNGSFVNSIVSTGTISNFNLSGIGNLHIGSDNTGTGDFTGAMQNLRLWNRALTATQVLAIYNAM
jgi:hypothetical protein